MNISIPLPAEAHFDGKTRTVYAPLIGYVGDGKFLGENSVPCFDCMGGDVPNPLEYVLMKASGREIQMIHLGVRSRVLDLLSVKVHEILYEGVCEKCKTTLRIVSLVNVYSLDASVSSSVR